MDTTFKGNHILEGPFLKSENRVLFFDDVDDTRLPFDEIHAIWEMRSARERGMLIGATLTAIASSAYVARKTYPGLIPFSLPLSSMVGALVGAAIGSGFGEWHQLYPGKTARGA